MSPLRCVAVVIALVALSSCRAPAGRPLGWQPLLTGTAASLRGLAVVDARVAFVGGRGTLLRTTDGGQSWQDVAPAGSEACDFRDLEAFDHDHVVAMVAGQPARIYRSSDGGVGWRIVHEDARPAAFFDAMAFDGTHGVLFGDAIDGAFALLVTDDAGVTWRPAPDASLPEPLDGEAGFAASGTCVVAADGARPQYVLVTGGGPCRWVQFESGRVLRATALPLRAGAPSAGAFSVALRGARAVVVGGDYEEPLLASGSAAVTVDGGASWLPTNAGGYRSAVVWLDDRQLLAVGSHGASRSVDGGRTWRVFDDTGFHSVAVGRDGSVWACGSDGRVAKLIVAQ